MNQPCEEKIQQQFLLESLVVEVSQKENLPPHEQTEQKEEGQKRCPRCKKILPKSEFHKNRSSHDGLAGVCKYCKYQTNKIYYSSPKGKLAVSGQTKRKWLRTNQRISCRNQVNWSILKGELKKQPCQICGEVIVEAHHEDYSKPYSIMWLCKKHHMEIHGKRISKIV